MKKFLPGYHLQLVSRDSLLLYLRYILFHDDNQFRSEHPNAPEMKDFRRPINRDHIIKRGGKTFRQSRKREKAQANALSAERVYAILDGLKAKEMSGEGVQQALESQDAVEAPLLAGQIHSSKRPHPMPSCSVVCYKAQSSCFPATIRDFLKQIEGEVSAVGATSSPSAAQPFSC